MWNFLLKMQGYVLNSDQIKRNFNKPSVSLVHLLVCFLSNILQWFENVTEYSWVEPCGFKIVSQDTRCDRLRWVSKASALQPSICISDSGLELNFLLRHANFRLNLWSWSFLATLSPVLQLPSWWILFYAAVILLLNGILGFFTLFLVIMSQLNAGSLW